MREVKSAVVLVEENANNVLNLQRLFGGETLLGRSLIALSKSGIESATILCRDGVRETLEDLISKVNPRRITLSIKIHETDDTIGHALGNLASGSSEPILLFPLKSILHPSMLTQLTTETKRTILPTYEKVRVAEGEITIDSSVNQKFAVMFKAKGWIRVNIQGDKVVEIGSGPLIAGPLIVLHPSDLSMCAEASDFDDLTRQLLQNGRLFTKPIGLSWWMPVKSPVPEQQVKDFFWKVAFKEISGEFSKAVNSKFSRPLSFWLANHGVAPDTISNASLLLFLASSSLLLIPASWALMSFAIIWQFSAGILDRCDGEVARIRNYETEKGGRFDMIIDDLRFILPFVFLGIMLGTDNNPLFWSATAACVTWTLGFTFYEQAYMRTTGYSSRQVLYVDYLKLVGEKQSSSFKKYVPLIKGDIRTFYVTILCFLGNRPLVFIVLGIYLTVVPLVSFFGIGKFKKAGFR